MLEKNSARWTNLPGASADGLLDDARPGEADERAGLGDVSGRQHA